MGGENTLRQEKGTMREVKGRCKSVQGEDELDQVGVSEESQARQLQKKVQKAV